MSRIGKKPIEIPKGVSAELKGREIKVKGPKGALQRELPVDVSVSVEGEVIDVKRAAEGRRFGAFQGLTRALIANMVKGVHEGFQKKMSLVGVGYRVALEGRKLVFNVGYSHQISFELPQGIEAEITDKGGNFVIRGADKELVGHVCAKIRSFRSPEPYKGKGIRYADEVVRQKAGKAGAK